MEKLIKISPDIERAKSLLEMVLVRLSSADLFFKTDVEKFTSKIVEEYYEALFELITALMALDGYKTRPELPGTHIETINYLRKTYAELTESEFQLLDELRTKRNGIKYYGRKVRVEYLQERISSMKKTIDMLKRLVQKKLK